MPIGNRQQYWILEGKRAVPADLDTWGAFFKEKERLLWNDTVGESNVSTVFLGLDHQYGEGPPLIFETLVFSGPLMDEMERYTTYEQAKQGHITMLARCIAAERKNGESKPE